MINWSPSKEAVSLSSEHHSGKLIKPKEEASLRTCNLHPVCQRHRRQPGPMTGVLRCRQGPSRGSEPVTWGAGAGQEASAGTGLSVWDAQLVSENRWGAWGKTTRANAGEQWKPTRVKLAAVTAATSRNSPNAQRGTGPEQEAASTQRTAVWPKGGRSRDESWSQRGTCTPVLTAASFTTAKSGDKPGIRHWTDRRQSALCV